MGTRQGHPWHRRERRTRFAVLAITVAVLASTASMGAAGPASAQAPAPAPDVGSPEASARWLQVDAGFLHACGITTTHRLYCWGNDGAQQLGNGGGRRNRNLPVEVAGARTDWAQVSAGYDATCAIRTDHRLFCWGSDVSGYLGNGAGTQDQSVPGEVAGGRTDWAQVSAGGGAVCATTTAGRLFCWGSDYRGSAGNGGGASQVDAPAQVAGAATDWASVNAGFAHVCARKTTGALFCFGDDTYGQLGDGAPTGSFATSPVAVAGNSLDWTSITTTDDHSCATNASGRLFCWGLDDLCALGAAGQDCANRSEPAEVRGTSTDWDQAAPGSKFTCALRTTGRIYCWGATWRAGLGQVLASPSRWQPLLLAGGFTDWRSVTTSLALGCAIRANGVLYCWGNNEFGQAGVGSTARKVVGPARVALSA